MSTDSTRKERLRSHPFEDRDELPHSIESVPGWSESFLVQAYCPEADIGVFAHSNRCHFDPSLWSEVIAIYLPHDRFAVAKGFGYAPSTTQLGGCLSVESPAPFERTITRYVGAAQLLDGGVLRAGPAPSGIHVGLELELQHCALGEPFGVGDIRPGALGHTHYEQHMSVSGHVTIDGSRLELEGTGLRDHTWGPRDLSVMGNHHWMHGEFPSGRWFTTTVVSRRDGGEPLLDFHVVGDKHGMTRAQLVSPPPLLDAENEVRNRWEVHLQTDEGIEVIEGEILSPMAFSFVGPVEMTLGVDRSPDASHAIYESQARLRWGGETGYGLCERSVVKTRN
ncbi:DUF7065 domain-containing protein [Nocardia sp. R16R-3T]